MKAEHDFVLSLSTSEAFFHASYLQPVLAGQDVLRDSLLVVMLEPLNTHAIKVGGKLPRQVLLYF
jgi:hypothetical protein